MPINKLKSLIAFILICMNTSMILLLVWIYMLRDIMIGGVWLNSILVF